MDDLQEILERIKAGDEAASRELFDQVYLELRRMASTRLARERPGQTLQPTALVHEVWLRLMGPDKNQSWNSAGHFLAVAAEVMRHVLMNNARRKRRIKHGGQANRVDLVLEQVAGVVDDQRLLALDEALEELAREDPVKARLVTMRYFGGLTVEQACEVLGISRATAHRYWTFARAWLLARLEPQPLDDQG
ncbi:MAG TPA: ECF-type sigma factor [Pirellulaceae bacterium]|nr:ECF-type sigma factor [Pirellulaceae bacterium]